MIEAGHFKKKRFAAIIYLLTTLVFLVCCGSNISKPSPGGKVGSVISFDIESASQFAVIDQSEPAFIVITGIPNNLDEIKLKVWRRTAFTMLTWQKFLERVGNYTR